jgi:hypothetical protein
VGTKDPQVTVTEFAAALQLWDPDDQHNLREALGGLDPGRLPGTMAAACRSDTELRLAVLCEALQRFWGQQPFYLAVRQAADLLGVGRDTAHRALRALETAGIIRRVKTGTWADRKASTWRFLHP